MKIIICVVVLTYFHLFTKFEFRGNFENSRTLVSRVNGPNN